MIPFWLPFKSKDYEGFLKIGMEYADVIIKSEEISENLSQLIEECSKDKKCEINSEEEEELFESYYNIYTDLAG
jgi:starch synthase